MDPGLPIGADPVVAMLVREKEQERVQESGIVARILRGRSDGGRPPETVLAGYTLGLLAVTWLIVRMRFL